MKISEAKIRKIIREELEKDGRDEIYWGKLAKAVSSDVADKVKKEMRHDEILSELDQEAKIRIQQIVLKSAAAAVEKYRTNFHWMDQDTRQ